MTALNSNQKNRVRRMVAMVRRLQADKREAYERVKAAARLRSGIVDKVDSARRELEEIRSSAPMRYGDSTDLITKAEKHLRHVEAELALYDEEIREANAISEAIGADLALAQPVAEKLISLIDDQDPIRKMFDWSENPALRMGGIA